MRCLESSGIAAAAAAAVAVMPQLNFASRGCCGEVVPLQTIPCSCLQWYDLQGSQGHSHNFCGNLLS